MARVKLVQETRSQYESRVATRTDRDDSWHDRFQQRKLIPASRSVVTMKFTDIGRAEGAHPVKDILYPYPTTTRLDLDVLTTEKNGHALPMGGEQRARRQVWVRSENEDHSDWSELDITVPPD